MNRFILLLCSMAFLVLSQSYTAPPDCSNVQTGRYYYYTKKTREKIIVERNDTMQTEVEAEGGELQADKVVWTSPCSYDMYIGAYTKTLITHDDSLLAITPFHIRIVEVTNSFYICDASMHIFEKDFNIRDTMYFLTR